MRFDFVMELLSALLLLLLVLLLLLNVLFEISDGLRKATRIESRECEDGNEERQRWSSENQVNAESDKSK